MGQSMGIINQVQELPTARRGAKKSWVAEDKEANCSGQLFSWLPKSPPLSPISKSTQSFLWGAGPPLCLVMGGIDTPLASDLNSQRQSPFTSVIDLFIELCLSTWFLIYQQEILSFTHDVAGFLVRVYSEENSCWNKNPWCFFKMQPNHTQAFQRLTASFKLLEKSFILYQLFLSNYISVILKTCFT